MEEFFATSELPQSILLKEGERNNDVSAFIKGHLEIVKTNGHIPAFSAFYDRLYLLMELLKYGDLTPEEN